MKKYNLLKNIAIFLIIANLNYAYVKFIYPKFAYAGFKYDFNYIKLIEAFIFLIVIIKITDNLKKEMISYNFFNTLFLMNYIPINTYYYLANAERKYFYSVSLAYILILIILKYIKLRRINIRKIKISKKKISEYLLIYTILIYIIFLCTNVARPKISVLYLKDVYETRRSINLNKIWNYLIIWQGYVFNVYCFVTSFVLKKYFMLLLAVIIQLLLYMTIPHKTFLFEFIIIYISLKIFQKNQYVKLILILSATILSIINIYTVLTKNILLVSLFMRRAFFLPALLNNIYFDYIKTGGKFLYYSEGIIGKILNLSYPYEIPFPKYIGEYYFSSPQMAANTGLFADAYVNLGYTGIFITALILGLFFKILDTFKAQKKIMIFGMYSFIIMNLVNGSLLTWFLTGGGIIPIILIFFTKEE